jgi:hypothetical protein
MSKKLISTKKLLAVIQAAINNESAFYDWDIITAAEAETYLIKVGINLTGYKHVVSSSELKHILNRHG